MKIHLVDGTYELFRHHFGAPPHQGLNGQEVGATLGLLKSLVALLARPDVTHLAVAFDHVIESFRNDLYPGYKTGAGVDPQLKAQFSLAEEAVSALGIVTWPMIEFEADDALASAVDRFKDDPLVEQFVICSPDKDLAQLVSGSKVVCWDRRRDIVLDEAEVQDKFGVKPSSIPDWLALVGDSADGFPGLPGWGAKSAASILSRFGHLENIPDDITTWSMPATRAGRLAQTLSAGRKNALLFRQLATLRRDVPIGETVFDLEWSGARPAFNEICRRLDDLPLASRITRWRAGE